jgi:myb proto-oncogene protein
MDLKGTFLMMKEDECLLEIISSHGPLHWTYIAKKLEKQYLKAKRSGKQCRERWFNHLNTGIDNSEWSLH